MCVREKNNSFEIHVIILRHIQGWYSQGRKLWISVKSRKVEKSQGKSGNCSGGQGEKYSLKFESREFLISNISHFVVLIHLKYFCLLIVEIKTRFRKLLDFNNLFQPFL